MPGRAALAGQPEEEALAGSNTRGRQKENQGLRTGGSGHCTHPICRGPDEKPAGDMHVTPITVKVVEEDARGEEGRFAVGGPGWWRSNLVGDDWLFQGKRAAASGRRTLPLGTLALRG